MVKSGDFEVVKIGGFEVVKIANFSRLSGALFFRCIIGFMLNSNKNLENCHTWLFL